MSGLTNADRNYWISYLRSKVEDLLKEYLKDKQPEKEAILEELITSAFTEANVSTTHVEALRINHARQDVLRKELKQLEEESHGLARELGKVFEKKYTSSRFSYHNGWDDFYPTFMHLMKEANTAEAVKELRRRYPRVEELEKLREDISVQVMWATTASALKEVVGKFLERLGITM